MNLLRASISGVRRLVCALATIIKTRALLAAATSHLQACLESCDKETWPR